MKTLVIYYSKTGFTKKYCEWLAQDIDCDLVSFEQVNTTNLKDYNTIIFASWIHAGNVQKLKWFEEQQLNDINKIVLVTGASPAHSPDVDEALTKIFQKELEDYKYFYLPGGLSYEKMSFGSKTMMKMFAKMMKNKKDKTKHEQEMADNLGSSFDNSDKKYLDDVIKYLNSIKE